MKLVKIEDCTINQIMDYIENKLENYDIKAVYINEDRSVYVEYWNNRAESRDLELNHDRRIRVE